MSAYRMMSMVALAGGLAMVGNAPAQEEAPQLDAVRRVSQIIGAEVRGGGDENQIADVNDLIMDGNGNTRFILIGRGGVAGVGEEVIAVPFHAATIANVEDRGWYVQLDQTEEELDQAPTLDEGRLQSLSDPNWLQTNREFFQVDESPSIQDQGAEESSLLFRASALRGAQVQGQGGEDSIANVDEILLDDRYRAAYAVLGYGGVAGLAKQQVPVPLQTLEIRRSDQDSTQLLISTTMTMEQLQAEDAPKLEGEYERMLDPTFITQVHDRFGASGQQDQPQIQPENEQP